MIPSSDPIYRSITSLWIDSGGSFPSNTTAPDAVEVRTEQSDTYELILNAGLPYELRSPNFIFKFPLAKSGFVNTGKSFRWWIDFNYQLEETTPLAPNTTPTGPAFSISSQPLNRLLLNQLEKLINKSDVLTKQTFRKRQWARDEKEIAAICQCLSISIDPLISKDFERLKRRLRRVMSKLSVFKSKTTTTAKSKYKKGQVVRFSDKAPDSWKRAKHWRGKHYPATDKHTVAGFSPSRPTMIYVIQEGRKTPYLIDMDFITPVISEPAAPPLTQN